jgi:ABC-type transport system involved in multi-copper enzyme maturation permease subunit
MTKVLSIAWITLREALRQKLAVNLLLFALLVIVASIVVSELTFGEQYRIIADLCLSSAQLFGTLIAVFLGAGLVAGDVQRRSLYQVIAKPVARWQYVLGRYLGLVLTLWLNLAVMGLTTLVVLGVYTRGLGFLATAPLPAALLGLAAQFAMVGAIAILFSSFTNTTLAAIFTLSLAASGYFARELFTYWRGMPILRAVGLALPNLAALDLKVALVYQEPVAGGPFALSLAYAALYVAVTLSVAAAVFGRRDLR